ncbi:PssE/Cps14G family polysaccharide biosynthesis glycosyltransferase [Clostridium intestinale]|uniref:PssE/Cps14G family polysaccharide biosynthesis glycosyltransferase n=1 Tax=Clostridium intestinale TaxID=36845 RepID=UPI0028E1E659|nr:PssE/Cps14G family polysaccharide biosynthesis glycosyltransferase [Clostridium intestinale]
MIFITLGSQKFQFDRLLKEIDKLILKGDIKEEVFAQRGYSEYIPKNFKYKDFLNRDEFQELMKSCDLVVTHGGTGAIVTALKNSKKVVAVARLSEYGEHVDDHQIDIVTQFSSINYIIGITDIEELENSIIEAKNKSFNKYVSNTNKIIDIIEDFLK